MIHRLSVIIFKLLLGFTVFIIAGNVFTFLTGQAEQIIQPVALPIVIPLLIVLSFQSFILVIHKLLSA